MRQWHWPWHALDPGATIQELFYPVASTAWHSARFHIGAFCWLRELRWRHSIDLDQRSDHGFETIPKTKKKKIRNVGGLFALEIKFLPSICTKTCVRLTMQHCGYSP